MRTPVIKLVTLGVIFVLALAPLAEAGAKKGKKKAPKTTRTESHPYSGFSGVEAQGSNLSFCVQDSGCLSLTPQKEEDYVSIEVTDASGTAAPFQVTFHDASTTYCGTTDPIWLNEATEVAVSILAASASCSGVGTSGTLNATFSNRL